MGTYIFSGRHHPGLLGPLEDGLSGFESGELPVLGLPGLPPLQDPLLGLGLLSPLCLGLLLRLESNLLLFETLLLKQTTLF